jgi:hypothetical protein
LRVCAGVAAVANAADRTINTIIEGPRINLIELSVTSGWLPLVNVKSSVRPFVPSLAVNYLLLAVSALPPKADIRGVIDNVCY